MDKQQIKEFIARRASEELKNGDVVNLGIGIPTLCTKFLPEDVCVVLQSENGIIDTAAVKPGEEDFLHLIDASAHPAAINTGGCIVDSAMSMALIRGGHVHACILGGLEVDQEGNLANWMIPGKKMPGMGGAMDLLVGSQRVIVAMEHTSGGVSKIRRHCSLPLTGMHCVDRIITQMAVFDVVQDGLLLLEYNPVFGLEAIAASTEADYIISPNLKQMH